MKLYIKNMVCDRCKMIVKGELDNLGIRYLSINIGKVILKEALTSQQYSDLNIA